MTDRIESSGTVGRAQWPAVRTVTASDLLEVLAAGLGDFRRAPLYGLVLGGAYVLGGWILILLLIYADLPFLVYPLAAGFALVAPFAATGFYAVSCCLEAGEPLTWPAVWRLVRRAAGRDLGWMALVTGFSLFLWVDIAAMLFFGFMGFNAMSVESLVQKIFTTPIGLLFLLIGNTVGAAIALGVFSVSVISVPMLFDRDCDFVTAMVTSVRLVLANRVIMVFWCALIAGLLAVSLLSGLMGLFLVLPVLGHASWHLYRRSVAPAEPAQSD